MVPGTLLAAADAQEPLSQADTEAADAQGTAHRHCQEATAAARAAAVCLAEDVLPRGEEPHVLP